MGRTVHREIYKPLAYYPDLKPVNENIEIIRFEAPLNFVTVSAFLGKMSEVLRSDANQDYELQSMKNVSRLILVVENSADNLTCR